MAEQAGENRPLILIADDEESNIMVFRRPLAKAGYETMAVANGAAAIAAAAENDVDVIIMDWMMPGMSGPEACAAIKSTEKGRLVPIIMVTAKTAAEDVKAGLDAGADDYITKPVRMDEALARIRAALRQRGMEKELDGTNRRLVRLMEQKDEFLNIASHDIRAPLNAILGFTDALLKEEAGPLTPAQTKFLGTIHRAGKRQLKLVNDLLDLSRLEAGGETLDMGTVDIDALISETHEVMAFNARSKEIELSASPGFGRKIRGDEGKIMRVLHNLASNAIKFTPRGGKVAISSAQSGGDCVITVSDTGPGIPAEEMPRLFGKFSRLSTRPTAGEHGSGLGLSISRHIVEMHGGRIWAESSPGEGTRLFFSLPASGPGGGSSPLYSG